MKSIIPLMLAQSFLGLVLAQRYDSAYDKDPKPYASSAYSYDKPAQQRYGGYDDSKDEYRKTEYGYGSQESGDKGNKEEQRGGRYYFGGKYSGKCGPDGLYYRDEYSFVICSNAQGYVQPCAPGSQNSGFTDYAPGYYYGYSDFCNINLVDFGFAAPKFGPGYGDRAAYGSSAQGDSVAYGPAASSNYVGDFRGRSYGSNGYNNDYQRPYQRTYDNYRRPSEEVYN